MKCYTSYIKRFTYTYMQIQDTLNVGISYYKPTNTKGVIPVLPKEVFLLCECKTYEIKSHWKNKMIKYVI